MKRILLSLILIFSTVVYAYQPGSNLSEGDPFTHSKIHDVGNMWLNTTNYGYFGNGGNWGICPVSLIYPAYSDQEYLYQGAIWISALVGNDTFCSVGVDGWQHNCEFYPGDTPGDSIVELSNLINSPLYDSSAISEQDFRAVYYDTYTDPSIGSLDPYHNPLGIKVIEKSYSWSDEFSEDFIIFEMTVINIGSHNLKQMHLGIYYDGDCGPTGALYSGDKSKDDVTGFLGCLPSNCGGNLLNPKDSLNLAWMANSCLIGVSGTTYGIATPDVVGIRVLRTPNPQVNTSYNWWISDQTSIYRDWGPAYPDNPFDTLFAHYVGYPNPGTPSYDDYWADILKWLLMANNAVDPDQIDIHGPYAAGDTIISDSRFLLSWGPIFPSYRNNQPVTDSIFMPGDTVKLVFAVVGGEDFQLYDDPPSWNNHPFIQPGDTLADSSWSPYRYDFTDLGLNAKVAMDFYDNPGIVTEIENGPHAITHQVWWGINPGDTVYADTLDPYFSWPQPVVIQGDTIEWTGDGIPDYCGPREPNYPEMMVITGVPRATDVCVLWGRRERVAQDSIRDSLWNLLPDEQVEEDLFYPHYEDFQGYRIYKRSEIGTSWTLLSQFDRGNRRIRLYPDDPLSPLVQVPLGNGFGYGNWIEQDTIRAPHANYEDSIYKLEVQLRTNPDLGPLYSYQDIYRYIYIDSNQTTFNEVEYSVTCFDFGNPLTGVLPVENVIEGNAVKAIVVPYSDQLSDDEPVLAVPNPYRGDVNYRGGDNPWETDQQKRICFINLPPQCEIKIFTLSGEMVRLINHQQYSYENWDLKNISGQEVASGIYLFVVEEPGGNTQTGKLAIVK
ncbi:MAG: hypothetical protein ACP5FK_07145 [bacterium]